MNYLLPLVLLLGSPEGKDPKRTHLGMGGFQEMGPRFAREWPVYFFVSVFAEVGMGYIHHPYKPLKGTRWEGMDRALQAFNIPKGKDAVANLTSFHMEAGVKGWAGAEFGAGILFAGGYDPLGYLFGEFGLILPHYGNGMLGKILQGPKRFAQGAGEVAKKVATRTATASTAAAAAPRGIGAIFAGWRSFVKMISSFRDVIRWLAITSESGYAVVYYFTD